MSVYLYRLYAVQSFDGEKVAVYTSEGNYPDSELLGDAIDIVEGNRTRKEVLEYKDWKYGLGEVYPEDGRRNRDRLTYYTRKLRHSKKVLDQNGDVKKAIFVGDPNPTKWRGERTLYENKVFDMIKADTPQYSACEAIGTITL